MAQEAGPSSPSSLLPADGAYIQRLDDGAYEGPGNSYRAVSTPLQESLAPRLVSIWTETIARPRAARCGP
jgi:hypothetical protein